MISIIFELSATLFDSILQIYFIIKFNHSTWKNCKFAFAATLSLFLCTIFFDYTKKEWFVLQTSLCLAISVIFSFTIPQIKKAWALLSAFLFTITLIALSSLLLAGFTLIIGSSSLLLTGSNSVIRLIYVSIHKLLLFATLQFILHFFLEKGVLEFRNSLLAFLFTLTTILGLGAVLQVLFIADHLPVYFYIVTAVFAFITVNIIFYWMLRLVMKLQQDKYERKALEEKASFEQTRYKDILENYENIRKLRHDMNQHLTLLSFYLEKGDIPRCREYIAGFLPGINPSGKYPPTGNGIIDYLINSKLAELENVNVSITGLAPDLSDIKESDLASLMGNILDNAAQAQKGLPSPHIELLFYRHNDNRYICCRNRIESSVLKSNPSLKTSKANPVGHGYGCHIIREIIEKYHGILSFFEEEDMFGVQFVLPLLPEKE